jgi:6-phosphofructokinase 2
MARIVTLTMNPAIDKSTSIDRVAPEQKLRCAAPAFDPGGGGINVSRAVHKLGGKSTAYYTAGRALGRMLEKLLEDEGLDHRPLPIDDRTRESFSVYESSTGQQYRFSTPGPELKRDEWEGCLAQLASMDSKPDYLVASGSLPPGVPADYYARLARLAGDIGARMVLDATGEPFSRAVAEGVFLIKPNLREFRALTGKALEDEAQQVAAAEKLIAEDRCSIVVISLGAAGVLMVSQDGSRRLRAPTVAIKSKVGAGDSMVGGIVTAMAENRSPVAAVQFGVAAGAAAVMTPGTRLCRREDTWKLFNQIRGERKKPT